MKPLQMQRVAVQAAERTSYPDVERRMFGTGHIRADRTAILGGKVKLSGIVAGKATFQMNGKKWRSAMTVANFTSLM